MAMAVEQAAQNAPLEQLSSSAEAAYTPVALPVATERRLEPTERAFGRTFSSDESGDGPSNTAAAGGALAVTGTVGSVLSIY